MFYQLFDDRKREFCKMVDNKPTWVKHMVCATFFTNAENAIEVMDMAIVPEHTILLYAGEDLSAYNIENILTELLML